MQATYYRTSYVGMVSLAVLNYALFVLGPSYKGYRYAYAKLTLKKTVLIVLIKKVDL